MSNSFGGGGGGSESSDNVEPEKFVPRSSGGGGSENVESVIHAGIASSAFIGFAGVGGVLISVIVKLLLLLLTSIGICC